VRRASAGPGAESPTGTIAKRILRGVTIRKANRFRAFRFPSTGLTLISIIFRTFKPMRSPRELIKDLTRQIGVASHRPTEPFRDLVRRLRPVPCGHELVRIGGAHDGGYLLPDDLAGIEACFSPGTGRVADFERDLLARGIPSHMADATVEKPPFTAPGVTFESLLLGSRDVGERVTLGRWMRRHRPEPRGDLLLQMDIEGGEYDVLPNADPADLARFRIVVVEFHRLEWLADPFHFRVISQSFEKLLDQFAVVHLHPNNTRPFARCGDIQLPRAMEFTFLRRDRIRPGGPPVRIPHPLDADCSTRHPTAGAPAGWVG
jgi:hypothetical protein